MRRKVNPPARQSAILSDVIRTYVRTGNPVSSRSIERLGKYGLSSATIRNAMADLEDEGFLMQPHTSSGRVPTAAGYHYYIDSLMPNHELSDREQLYIQGNLTQALIDLEEMLGRVTHLLFELTQQIGVVLAPAIAESRIRALHFLNLSGRRVLCVLESEGGLVEHRVIRTTSKMSSEELVKVSNFLTQHFCGLTLRQMRHRLVDLMADERARIDSLIKRAVALAQQALGVDEEPELLFEGTETMLVQPELSDIERVRKLLSAFTDKAELVRMLDQLIKGEGTKVIIGEESDLTSDLNFSLVATSYGSSDRTLGALGIFGPSRMEYEKVVPLVDFLGKTVSDTLARRG